MDRTDSAGRFVGNVAQATIDRGSQPDGADAGSARQAGASMTDRKPMPEPIPFGSSWVIPWAAGVEFVAPYHSVWAIADTQPAAQVTEMNPESKI